MRRHLWRNQKKTSLANTKHRLLMLLHTMETAKIKKVALGLHEQNRTHVKLTIHCEIVTLTVYTPCLKKTKQICFCQKCVKFSPILIIFGRKMANDPNVCEVQHSFSTSPNLRHHLTVLNANVPNCYITPNVVICNKLLKT